LIEVREHRCVLGFQAQGVEPKDWLLPEQRLSGIYLQIFNTPPGRTAIVGPLRSLASLALWVVVFKYGFKQAAALRCGLESNALPLCASAMELYGGGAVPAALTRAHNLLKNRPPG